MRAFVALEISGQVLDSLANFQMELAGIGADVKVVERQNLHFTIRFLGEISEQQATEVESRLGNLALKRALVEVKGVGAFPNAARPRVLWAGVAAEHRSLVESIAQQVIDSIRELGEPDDKPFQAHVTLGRVRSTRNIRQLGDLLHENSDRLFGVVSLSQLKLKSSVLTSGGPVYTDLGVYQLA